MKILMFDENEFAFVKMHFFMGYGEIHAAGKSVNKFKSIFVIMRSISIN